MWVTSNAEGTLSLIDPSTREVVGKPTPVGAEPRGVAAGEDSVWVASYAGDSVARIDPVIDP